MTLHSLARLMMSGLVILTAAGCAAPEGSEDDESDDVGESSDAVSVGRTIADLEQWAPTAFANDERAHPAKVAMADYGDPAPSTVDPAHINTLLGKGTWSYAFTLVDGSTKKVIAAKNLEGAIYGASLMKVFTGWSAFKGKSVTPALVAMMARPSDARVANAIMCQTGAELASTGAKCTAVDTLTPAMKMPAAVGAAKEVFARQGMTLSPQFVLVDGSGVSSRNRVTINDVNTLLMNILEDPEEREFRDLLAHPGTGTLNDRFVGVRHPLQAKTGTFVNTAGGVKALAGFVDLSGGATLVFAVVGNGVGDPVAAFARIEKAVRHEILVAEAALH